MSAYDWQAIRATVIRGHRVASGLSKDSRFPGGTLAMQQPFFKGRGLDLSDYYLSTLNLSIAPASYEIIAPKFTFRAVAWHPSEPAEDFSFFDCRIRKTDSRDWIDGLIYFPHPETKPDHFQPADVLEVIAARLIGGIDYGTTLEFQVHPEQIRLLEPEKK